MNIPVYDGASKDELETWLDQIEIACQIARREQDIKKVALGKSKGAALHALRSLDNAAPWGIVKDCEDVLVKTKLGYIQQHY